jgi:hypothetical protein
MGGMMGGAGGMGPGMMTGTTFDRTFLQNVNPLEPWRPRL